MTFLNEPGSIDQQLCHILLSIFINTAFYTKAAKFQNDPIWELNSQLMGYLYNLSDETPIYCSMCVHQWVLV